MKLAWKQMTFFFYYKTQLPAIPKTSRGPMSWCGGTLIILCLSLRWYKLTTKTKWLERVTDNYPLMKQFLVDFRIYPATLEISNYLKPGCFQTTSYLGYFQLSQAIDDRFVWSKMKGLRKEDSKEHPTTQSKPYVRVWMYFLRQKHHISLMSFSVTAFRTCFSSWMNSTL